MGSRMVHFTCTYCGYKWRKEVYTTADIEKCSVCGDAKVDAVELSKYCIDSYQGCPDFPEDEEESGNTEFDMFNFRGD